MSLRRLHNTAGCALALCLTVGVALAALTGPAQARSASSVATAAMHSFAQNCFSPFLTAQRAQDRLSIANTRYEFYDLDPFSSAAPSPVIGRAATPGTDRRCEMSFPGDFAAQAAYAAERALDHEGITEPAALPSQFERTEGTHLLAARRLNPRRVAVVHVGLRDGAWGQETFMLVERMMPKDG